MHFAGQPSWRMNESTRHDVLFALYVREACGIRKLAALPPLHPDIPRLAVPSQAGLDAQWGRWWATVIEPELVPPSGPLVLVPGTTHTVTVPESAGELIDVLQRLSEPATEWTMAAKTAMGLREVRQARRGGMEVVNLVNGFADELGRPVHPFRLDVEILPTTQRGLWWIGQQTIAVSGDLRDDAAAYVTALRPVVAGLA